MVDNDGYDKYFLLNAKKMNVENFDLSNASVKTGKTGELKDFLINQCNQDLFRELY